MALTVDLLAKYDWNDAGAEQLSIVGSAADQSVSSIEVHRISLDSNTANYKVSLGSLFNTAIHCMIKETGGYTFTYSRDVNNRHHLVNANGFVMWVGNTTALYLSNNNANAGEQAQLTIILAG